ncbi:MAG: hypothetical protein N2116_03990 [Armatimonadetes bacterium]|nr:hypothetical protein [Armatimonadota bacterium]
MRREVPTWVAIIVIVVVIVVAIAAYVAIERSRSLPPTTPPPGWKPQPMGPYPKGKGMMLQQPTQPQAQPQTGTQ